MRHNTHSSLRTKPIRKMNSKTIGLGRAGNKQAKKLQNAKRRRYLKINKIFNKTDKV